MAVQTFLGAIFNLVTRWEAGDRLEEGLYGLLDSLKAPVPLKVGEPFSVVSQHADNLLFRKPGSLHLSVLQSAGL